MSGSPTLLPPVLCALTVAAVRAPLLARGCSCDCGSEVGGGGCWRFFWKARDAPRRAADCSSVSTLPAPWEAGGAMYGIYRGRIDGDDIRTRF